MISSEIHNSSMRFLLQVRFLKEIMCFTTESLHMIGLLEDIQKLKNKFLVQAGFQRRAYLFQGGLIFLRHIFKIYRLDFALKQSNTLFSCWLTFGPMAGPRQLVWDRPVPNSERHMYLELATFTIIQFVSHFSALCIRRLDVPRDIC